MSKPNFPSTQEHLDNLNKFNINQTRALFTIILSILLDVFGYTMVLPLLPSIVLELGAPYFMIGVLISSKL